jgi:hypothetical protein
MRERERRREGGKEGKEGRRWEEKRHPKNKNAEMERWEKS